MDNKYFEMKFDAIPSNEAFARYVVGAFMIDANPTLEELEDVKTAVSEAVTNCIVHGYEDKGGVIELNCKISNNCLIIEVKDNGVGICDIDKAMEPFFTSKPSTERSGMGLPLIRSFMSSVVLNSNVGKGTTIVMTKNLSQEEANVRA